MASLCIVHFDPILVRKQVRVEVVAYVRVPVLVDFGLRAQCFSMHRSILLVYQSIVPGKGVLSHLCVLNLDVETANTYATMVIGEVNSYPQVLKQRLRDSAISTF